MPPGMPPGRLGTRRDGTMPGPEREAWYRAGVRAEMPPGMLGGKMGARRGQSRLFQLIMASGQQRSSGIIRMRGVVGQRSSGGWTTTTSKQKRINQGYGGPTEKTEKHSWAHRSKISASLWSTSWKFGSSTVVGRKGFLAFGDGRTFGRERLMESV